MLEQDRLFNQVTNELKVRQAAGLGLAYGTQCSHAGRGATGCSLLLNACRVRMCQLSS